MLLGTCRRKSILLASIFVLLSGKEVFAQDLFSNGSLVFPPSEATRPITSFGNTEDSRMVGRKSEKTDKAEARVFVMSRHEFLALGCRTLADVLRYVPGFMVAKPFAAEFGEGFRSRGFFGNEQIAILRNGIPVIASSLGTVPLGHNINLAGIERIEVQYSPGSSIYGSAAQGGVINLITFAGDANDAVVQGSIGTEGEIRTSFSANKVFAVGESFVRVRLGGAFGRQTDWNMEDNFGEQLTPPRPFVNESPRNLLLGNKPGGGNAFGFSADWEGFFIEYHRFERQEFSSLGRDRSLYYYYEPTARIGETVSMLSGGYTYTGDDFFASLTVRNTVLSANPESMYNRRFSPDAGILPNNLYSFHASDDLLIQAAGGYDFGEMIHLNGGISYATETGLLPTNYLLTPFLRKGYTIGTRPSDNAYFSFPGIGNFGQHIYDYAIVSAFVRATAHVSDDLTLSLNGRFDNHSHYGTAMAWRAGASYDVSGTTRLFGNIGTTFHFPPYRYANTSRIVRPLLTPGALSDYINIPSSVLPDNPYPIATETGLAAELGATIALSEGIVVHGTAFFNRRSAVAEEIPILPFEANATLRLTPPLFPQAFIGDTATTFLAHPETDVVRFGLHAILELQELIPTVSMRLSLLYLGGEDRFLPFSGLPYILSPDERDYSMLFDPNIFLQADVRWSVLPTLYIAAFASYHGAIRTSFAEDNSVAAALRADLSIGYHLSNDLHLWVRGDNIFGGRFSAVQPTSGDFLTPFPQPGRIFSMGITYIIN